MTIIPPPSTDAQTAIREAAILAHRAGDPARAARWLESCWTRSASTHPNWNDLLYYANAAIQLGLMDMISNREFVKAMEYVRVEQPLLDEPASLREEYTKYYQPKAASPCARSQSGPERSSETEARSIAEGTIGRAGYPLLNQAIRKLQDGRDLPDALQLSHEALARFREAGDREGEADALHFAGRIEHEMNHFDQASALYEQALKIAREFHNDGQIARARHERARLYSQHDYDFVQAESGFRFALDYYARIRDLANMQAAMKALARLAQTALSYDEVYLPKLRKYPPAVGSPEAFLHIRGVVIKAELLSHNNRYMELLLQWGRPGGGAQHPAGTLHIGRGKACRRAAAR
jgi:tetratricopeptide (TPR) repeat protein